MGDHNISSFSNLTEKQYLEVRMGPQQISSVIIIPITIVYVLIFVSGIIGNIVVCLAITRNSHFQTPTNYYLFSLAISDLLILIFGLPNDLKLYWQQYPWMFGETVCKLRALVAEMTSYASVLTIVAFSTERYIAICYPLFIQTVSSLSRCIKIITLVWIIACISAIPFAIFTKVNYVEYPIGSGNLLTESAFCSLPMENHDISLPLLQFATFAFFCLPMTLIIILYVKIGLTLRHSSRVTSDGSTISSPSLGSNRQCQVRRSINKMLVAVVIAFFLCWAPFHAQRLLVVYVHPRQWTMNLRTLNEVLYYLAGCLYYFSATINPILYSLMSTKYREAFRRTLCLFSQPKHQRSSTQQRGHTEPCHKSMCLNQDSFCSKRNNQIGSECSSSVPLEHLDITEIKRLPNEESSSRTDRNLKWTKITDERKNQFHPEIPSENVFSSKFPKASSFLNHYKPKNREKKKELSSKNGQIEL
ncbi:neuropeptides capa receptor-like [Limulus polyphemus]|uniref:Neuropeptides capa receptor-like n=1 Tax=Limulus polyphemus TaxID=6850 RepID=A0ABM1B192_LIMPO|nr:neuropeptides capa receptor-like [Limulus polyphemus]